MRPMQSMFPRKRHQVPSLNVASMPDLIFTSDEVKVKLQVPQGKDVQKLANKASVVNIYIGQFKGEWAVQLNGDLVSPDDIPARIEEIRGGMSAENADKLTVSLRADRRTPMGVITDVKQALQQSYALRINYSATELK